MVVVAPQELSGPGRYSETGPKPPDRAELQAGVCEEIARVEQAILRGDKRVAGEYDGLEGAMKRSVSLTEQATPGGGPRADPLRQHLANGLPLRGAPPMTGLRVMPRLECENDVGGRFTLWPSRYSHGTSCLSASPVASYASAAKSVSAARAAPTSTGATPPSGCLVRHRGRWHVHAHATLPGGRSRIRYPCRKAVQRRCGAADRQFYRPSSRCVRASPEDRARTHGERQTVGCRERRAMSRRFGSPETLGCGKAPIREFRARSLPRS